ncbi:MAG: exodeoxyribonuclease V subunit beta [Deltaproteobacteria bacterium]|nr:exodeoxyribonuclease V subunit beta [Deltaproteobacteria bacterium]
MTEVRRFDLLNSPLAGTNLIEASAGTGKTYTIAGLFLRLVLEKNLPVNEILVVTFTEAATQELKDRIRTKLREAIGAFASGHSEDDFLKDLVNRSKNTKIALDSLREAIRAFDQAAIFTIHGFCRRMLHENAFESGSLFDTELITDQESLIREIVDDFWRMHFYGASPLFINYVLTKKFSPNSLLSLLANRVAQPYLKIIPQVEIPDTSLKEQSFKTSFDTACKAWQSARPDVAEIFANYEGLHRGKYGKAKINDWIQAMDHYMASGGHNPGLFKGFEKFTTGEIQESIKQGHAPPEHPFFDLCEILRQNQKELERLFEQRLLGLKAELFHYVRDELTRRKTEKNIQSFDDLLLKLLNGLEDKGGELLAKEIRTKFKAALIDEFQDTDPIQYAIFKNAFNNKNSILFLIGDPKQAIYSFRGADIFAYMEASQDAESRFTLRENWRSEPGLITAINALFANKVHPFVYDRIPFQPTAPPSGKDPELLNIRGQSNSPLKLWFVDAEKTAGPGKAITKGQARELIPRAVASEISRLLALGRNKKAVFGKRPLVEGDIAVLVRTNAEARLMQKALLSLRIPSVLYSTDKLFDTHEAMEMERVLSGIAGQNSQSSLKAALITDMMGIKGEELDAMMADETGWETWLVRFKEYHDLWNKRGFIRMFRSLLIREEVLPRLMSFSDGERRNTNLLHLAEVLHQISVEKNLNMEGLIKWLSEQRDPDTPWLEEHQLRLESDENAVKLVTVHKSKGLEYPVVFCPFTWDGSRIKNSKTPFTFHNELDGRRLTLDLGSKDMEKNRVFAEKELLAENLRLFYVALTRAKSRCYLVWGRFNQAETSAPGYLFHHPGSRKQEDIVDATKKRFVSLSDEDLYSELNTFLKKSGGTISLSEMPVQVGEEHVLSLPEKEVSLTCLKFSGNIDRQWHISSFSSLISGIPHGEEIPDRDATGSYDILEKEDFEEWDAGETPAGIFSFPKGAQAGTFMHDIFEHLDFTEKKDAPVKGLVDDKLKKYGFEPMWQETLCRMILKVLAAPLSPKIKGLCLSRIRNQDRLTELEFFFPLKNISPDTLKKIFQTTQGTQIPETFPETMGRLQFATTRGFMKGFIDLVFRFQDRFYLVDWKSNHLGNRVEDYGLKALLPVMENEFYILQYHIYTLALDQYLRMRLPGYCYEDHFGGVFYVFLRGVDPEKGSDYGIYRDLPSPELIGALREALLE